MVCCMAKRFIPAMKVVLHLNLGPEGIGVALQDGLDGGLAYGLMLAVVAAVGAVAGVAVAACSRNV